MTGVNKIEGYAGNPCFSTVAIEKGEVTRHTTTTPGLESAKVLTLVVNGHQDPNCVLSTMDFS